MTLNGIVITPFKQWAVRLMQREASGETLPKVSVEAWREVFGFSPETSAKDALKQMKDAA